MWTQHAAERTAAGTLAIAAHPMGAAIAAAGELGLAGYEFYVLGRGGSMGDVKADVIASALSFFEPGWVRGHYDAGAAKISPPEAALAWNARIDEWAETGLSADLPLRRLCDVLGRVLSAAPLAGAPIFAGWRTMPEPASLPALTMHRLYGLRELRGGLHAGAVRAAGLTPLQALLIRTPPLAAPWGWPEPHPDVSGLTSAWLCAEEATNRAVAGLLGCLREQEAGQLADDIDSVVAHTGMMWWYREDTPAIQFGPRPEQAQLAGRDSQQ